MNFVRAGLVDDPKDYRFCGYSEAVAGRRIARAGLIYVIGEDDAHTWQAAHEYYRLMIIGSGAKPRAGKASISENLFEKTVQTEGKLPLTTVLGCNCERQLRRSRCLLKPKAGDNVVCLGKSDSNHTTPTGLPNNIAINHSCFGGSILVSHNT